MLDKGCFNNLKLINNSFHIKSKPSNLTATRLLVIYLSLTNFINQILPQMLLVHRK